MANLANQLEQLENAQLVWREPDADLSYLFKHGLTQESAYNSLLVKRRHEIHRLVAESYEKLYPDHLDEYASLLAHHFAAAGNDAKFVEYGVRAGDHSGRLGAEPEAEAHYVQALQALARLPDTAENRRVHIDILVKRTVVSFSRTGPEQSLSDLAEAAALVEDLIRNGAASPGDRLRFARVQVWIARMHFLRQGRRAALKDLNRVLPIAEELEDQELVALIENMTARIWLWGGEFNRALALLRQTLPVLEQMQNWMEWTLNDTMVGVALAAQGDYHSGIIEAEHALKRAGDLRFVNGTAVAHGMQAIIHLMGGAIRPMLEACRAALDIAIPSGLAIPAYQAFGMQALAESRLGQHQSARESMAHAEAIARKSGQHLLLDDWLAAFRVEMALNAGQIQETLILAEQVISFARSVDGKFAEALVQRSWGQALSKLDPVRSELAQEHFGSSLELFLAGGAVLEAARTHVAWGQLLQALGHSGRAREHFQQAIAQFRASGLVGELEQTRRVMTGAKLMPS